MERQTFSLITFLLHLNEAVPILFLVDNLFILQCLYLTHPFLFKGVCCHPMVPEECFML